MTDWKGEGLISAKKPPVIIGESQKPARISRSSPCKEPGCDRQVRAITGYCREHYLLKPQVNGKVVE